MNKVWCPKIANILKPEKIHQAKIRQPRMKRTRTTTSKTAAKIMQ